MTKKKYMENFPVPYQLYFQKRKSKEILKARKNSLGWGGVVAKRMGIFCVCRPTDDDDE